MHSIIPHSREIYKNIKSTNYQEINRQNQVSQLQYVDMVSSATGPKRNPKT